MAACVALIVDAYLIHGKREHDATALAALRTNDPNGGHDHGGKGTLHETAAPGLSACDIGSANTLSLPLAGQEAGRRRAI